MWANSREAWRCWEPEKPAVNNAADKSSENPRWIGHTAIKIIKTEDVLKAVTFIRRERNVLFQLDGRLNCRRCRQYDPDCRQYDFICRQYDLICRIFDLQSACKLQETYANGPVIGDQSLVSQVIGKKTKEKYQFCIEITKIICNNGGKYKIWPCIYFTLSQFRGIILCNCPLFDETQIVRCLTELRRIDFNESNIYFKRKKRC